MRIRCLIAFAAGLLVCWPGAPRAAGVYPLTLAASAQVKKGATTVTTTFTIRVDRLMAESELKLVTDALKFGGYPNFLPALRKLPPLGKIDLEGRSVELRYARETPDGKGHRLVLVADRPLFFLGEPTKPKAGYELTMVDLTLDERSAGTGTMAGAARVKPTPDGGVVVDDFAVAPVQLTVRLASAK